MPDRASGRRWDGANLQAFEGACGDCMIANQGKVFPAPSLLSSTAMTR